MEIEDAKEAQRLLLYIIGQNLEQLAIWRDKQAYHKHNDGLSNGMVDYYESWLNDSMTSYMLNSTLIKLGALELVRKPERKDPPKF